MQTQTHEDAIYRVPTHLNDADSQVLTALRQPVQPESPASEKTNTIIGWILQDGVMLSAALILLGLILFPFHTKRFSTAKLLTFPQTLAEVWTGLLILRPQTVITLGLLLL